MAGIVKLDTTGTTGGPLSNKEIGYSIVSEELYVGGKDGAAGADISTDPDAGGEYRVTRNKELSELTGRVDSLETRELTNKVDATVAPTATDDSDSGYEVGSLWIDTVADEAYRCADSTVDAAVWVNTTLTTDELSALIISYDNSDSEHTATNIKAAIDESAILKQTVNTTTTYTDEVTDTDNDGNNDEYKLYISNGEFVIERIS